MLEGKDAKKPLPGHEPVWPSNMISWVVIFDAKVIILFSETDKYLPLSVMSLEPPAFVLPDTTISKKVVPLTVT